MRSAVAAVVLAVLVPPGASVAQPHAQPSCAQPRYYVAQGALGVEVESTGLTATLRRADDVVGTTDSGLAELPIEIVDSEEPACHSLLERGFRVVPKLPLVPGTAYVLSVRPEDGCLRSAAPTEFRFVAPGEVALPSALPAPSPELLVKRCPRDYYYFLVDRPALPVPLAAGVEVRLQVDLDYHYCVEHGQRGEYCQPGQTLRHRMHWVALVPHTGARFDGPAADVVFPCDAARPIDCPVVPSVAAPADAGRADHDAASTAKSPPEATSASPVDKAASCSLTSRTHTASHSLMAWLTVLAASLLKARRVGHRRRP